MTPPQPPFTWRALHRRTLTHAWLKGLGTSGLMTLFFVAYFTVLNHPVFPVTIIPPTWLDHLIGFHPWTLPAYFSLWFYVSLPAALLTDRRQLLGYGLGCVALAVVGLTLFLLWPTTFIPPDLDWSQHPWLEFLKTTDSTGNACPSLHVAFSVFAALWLVRLLPELGATLGTQLLNALWAALIVFSTLGTHQHVALDALFGLALGANAAAFNFIAFPSPHPRAAERPALWTAVILIKLTSLLLWTSGVPLAWCLPLFLSAGALVLWHQLAPNAQGLVRVFSRFQTDRREVWLTFDDGPDPEDTPRLLDLLDQHQARATFFLIGQRAARHPHLVAEIARRGHEIAHHTHTHPTATFWSATPTRVHQELDAALPHLDPILNHESPILNHKSLILNHKSLTNNPPASSGRVRLFRAPVGIKPLSLGPALRQRQLLCLGWTLRSRDTFARDPAAVAAHVLKKVRPGTIILLHEGPPLPPAIRVQALAHLLPALTAAGYRCLIPPTEALR